MARCTKHDKVMPHYRCGESEAWLDRTTLILRAAGMYHQASTVEITRSEPRKEPQP